MRLVDTNPFAQLPCAPFGGTVGTARVRSWSSRY